MRMKDYFFARENGKIVIAAEPDISSEAIRLCGKAYGRDGFEDGQAVTTSPIAKIENGRVYTASGSVYELGEKNADYAEMISALNRGTPVLGEWRLEWKDYILDAIPDFSTSPDKWKTTSHEGYLFSGKDQEGKLFYGEVIGQNGNYLTIRQCEKDRSSSVLKFHENDIDIFVCWRNFQFNTEFEFTFFGKSGGILYEDLETAFMFQCRPKLFK